MRIRVVEEAPRLRVLVVEDEALIRLLAIDILEASGCQVSDAASAGQALQAAASQAFDVAVVDLGLPDASCTALLRGLLTAQPWLALVISTGRQADDPMVAAAREAGLDRIVAVLGKPWQDGALASAVRRAATLGGPARPSPQLRTACDAGAG